MAILITGGAGFIGSHTAVELLHSGEDIVIIDDLSNAKAAVIERIGSLTQKQFPFYQENCCNKKALERIFSENEIDSVIHFAGFKAVGESVQKPIEYYENNLISTLSLCNIMRRHRCKRLVFSSSATVYGVPKRVPIQEEFPTSATNPYGSTKLMIEQILKDICVSDPQWSIALLRYFNPIGAHKSGLLGEDPNGIPNNLMPYINQVALQKLPHLNVFGDDYPTHDGTGVRDYIHVVDLAKGHQKAIDRVRTVKGIDAYNLGTGKGYSVFDLIRAFENVSGVSIPYRIIARRAGDIAECYADPSKSERLLGWKAEKTLEEMCADSWNFTIKNPNGILSIENQSVCL